MWLLAAAMVALSAHDRQTFRVAIDAVRVDVLAADGGRPLTGLTAADFELRDNGVVQRVDSVSVEDVPLNVMLALDTSSSVRGDPLTHLKKAASAVATLLEGDDRMALLTFSNEIVLRMPWTHEKAHLARALVETTAEGSTALHDATYTALSIRSDTLGRTLVILFSDGEDTISWFPGQTVIDAARRTDAVVYAVTLLGGRHTGAGYRVDVRSGLQLPLPNVPVMMLRSRFLEDVCEETGGKHIDAGASKSLDTTFQQIVREFRTRYLLTYTPQGVDASGWHRLDVKLKNRRGEIRARRGYSR